MTDTGDLFGHTRTYPNAPGAKSRSTSFDASKAMEAHAPALRKKCIQALIEVGPSTADNIAAEIEADILSVRPRVSELARLGRIADSGERRPNQSGHKAIVWALNEAAP